MTVDLFDDEMFEDEPAPPPRPPRPPRRKRGARGETAKRVLVALPWIAFAIAIAVAGGIVFALAMIAIGIVCLREYVAMTADSRPLPIPAYMTVAALILAAAQKVTTTGKGKKRRRHVQPLSPAVAPYVQSLRLDGHAYAKPWTTYCALARGATLSFQLGQHPDRGWGAAAAAAPPSFGPQRRMPKSACAP